MKSHLTKLLQCIACACFSLAGLSSAVAAHLPVDLLENGKTTHRHVQFALVPCDGQVGTEGEVVASMTTASNEITYSSLLQ